MWKTVCSLIFALLLTATAQAGTSIIGSDGVTYKLAPPPVQVLELGKTHRVGEECEEVGKGLFHAQKVCTWQETLKATKDGIERAGGGSKTFPARLRWEVVWPIVGITLMLACLMALWSDLHILALVFVLLAAVAATFAALFASAITAVFAALFAFFSIILIFDDNTKWAYRFAVMYIIMLMIVIGVVV